MADTPLRANADPSWRTVHAVADEAVPALALAFLSAIETLARATGVTALLRALQFNDPVTTLAAIPFDTLAGRLAPMAGVLEATATRAAELALTRTLAAVSRDATLTVRLTGMAPSEEIRRWIASHGGELITDISAETRRAVQDVLTQATLHGQSPAQTARLLENVIGLNRRQAAAVARYTEAQIAAGVTGTRLERLVARYSGKLLRQRARAIARTESITAANRGNLETWLRNVREGVLLPDRWRVEWISVEDARTCPRCAAMDGQQVRIGEPFVSPEGELVAGPALHPDCRCTTALVRA